MEVEKAVNPRFRVYRHLFPNGKSYVGITSATPVSARWKNGKGYGNNPYMTHAIEKYGWDNVKHLILKGYFSLEDANLKERELIKRYRSNDPEYGYNITAGGDGKRGVSVPHTEESKRKISEGNRGKKRTERQKRRLSEMKKGQHMSEETKRKMSIAHLGKPLSESHRKAISEASVGKPGTFTGKTHSEETIRKMSEARRAYWEKKRGGAV